MDTDTMDNTTDIQCIFCGDNCGERICYGCQDTADMFGLDADDLADTF